MYNLEYVILAIPIKNEPGVTLSSGFAPKDYNDKDPNLAPNEQFTLTHNKELSRYYQKLIDQ
ncbi:hypothetical protein [Staphylococcus felis]|uniref:hypothetical protein n=1 Tax=Staphylococcus felis TaxID=46127 RepID=UPI0032DBBF1C